MLILSITGGNNKRGTSKPDNIPPIVSIIDVIPLSSFVKNAINIIIILIETINKEDINIEIINNIKLLIEYGIDKLNGFGSNN